MTCERCQGGRILVVEACGSHEETCPSCLGGDEAPDDLSHENALAQAARDADISQDYFLMWDVAVLLRDVAQGSPLALRAGILLALVEGRIEEVADAAKARQGAET